MGLEHRPYIGSWALSNRKLVQHTPDVLVYINGDVSLPGCASCGGNINVQQFVTQVSVDAGTDAGGSSATITLSVPVHYIDSFVRDAQFILHPGLEVHIYMRGYFPVEGMYSNFVGSTGAATSASSGGASQGATAQGWGPSYLDQFGMTNSDLDKILAYPYYQVFHGVITTVGSSWSPGTQSFTLTCSSMLWFWKSHRVNMNAAVFGARPQNSKARSSLVGNNFSGMHPYEIIYTLYQDTAGAADGIAYVLSDKTNQDARVPATGQNLFSLNLQYWRQRFNQREIKLRMHGLDGRLFNTAQAVFLSSLSSTDLTDILAQHYVVGNNRKPANIMSRDYKRVRRLYDEAVRLGFDFNTLVQQQRSAATDPDTQQPLQVNAGEMQAFVPDIQQWGTVQLFESTYESKLDVALKVCEVTGFEFYQDVDGDFVFKPPMYNLDTSSSRVYRLEDIDIISVNFTEQEPAATYCNMKGSRFKDLHTGAGLDNEWGVRGQYIDYRLVAQFGWKAYDLETAYYSDAKSCFFAAINRLDILNAPCKSASVTIPIRPELRPGYPVYIPYLDCYYYCNSFAHAYSFGGQCTTTLQLIARRAKFYAPGHVDQASAGISAIDLANTALPPLPLEVNANDGTRRLSGFPNVVMALDPYQLDPTFFFAGSDISDLDDPDTLYGLLKMAVDLGILNTDDKSNPGPYYWMPTAEGVQVVYYFMLGGNNTQAAKPPPQFQNAKVVALQQQADQMAANQTTSTQGASGSDASDLADLIQKVRRAFIRNDPAFGDLNNTSTLLDLLSDRKASMTDGSLPGTYRYYSASHPAKEQQGQPIVSVTKKNGKTTVKMSPPTVTGASDVLQYSPPGSVLTASGGSPPQAQFVKAKPQWGLKVLTTLRGGEVLSTDEIKEMMFAVHEVDSPRNRNSTQKGKVRVNPGDALRAYLRNAFDVACRNAKISDVPSNVFGPVVATLNTNITKANDQARAAAKGAKGFQDWPQSINSLTGSFTVLGTIVDITQSLAQYNFKDQNVITLSSIVPGYTKITSDFGARPDPLDKTKTENHPGIDLGASLGAPVYAALAGTAHVNQSGASESSSGVYTGGHGYGLHVTVDSGNGTTEVYGHLSQVAVSDGQYIQAGQLLGYVGSTGRSTGTHLHFEVDQNGRPVNPATARIFQNYNASTIWGMLAAVVADYTFGLLSQTAATWFNTMKTNGMDLKTLDAVQTAFYHTMNAAYLTPSTAPGTKTNPQATQQTQTYNTPVFPVSDAQGYEVVGSYRYGRDISIDPDGVFDVLHKLDPLRLLDTKAIADALTAALDGDKTASEKILLSALQQSMTDQQILDLGSSTTASPLLKNLGANWIADKATDGLMKIPLVNAGYSLADISTRSTHEICTCRAAEADVMLTAAGLSQFVSITGPGANQPSSLGSPNVDAVTKWVTDAAMSAVPQWVQGRQAMAGQVVDASQTNVVSAIASVLPTWQQQAETLRSQAQNLVQAATNLNPGGNS